MRVLMTAVPQGGHVFPMLPLATAFVDQGDDVVFAVADDASSAAAKVGLATRSIGRGLGDWFSTLSGRVRGTPGDGLPIDRVLPYFTPRLFAEVGADDMLDDLLALARDFAPDLVVHDTFAFAAPLVAAITDRPSVHVSIGSALDRAVFQLCTDALSPVWRSFGHDVPPFGGVYSGSTLDIFPSAISLPHPAGADVRPLRPTAPPMTADSAYLPDWLQGLANLPTVYVTLGTALNSDADVFRAIIDGLASEPLNVVVTVGTNNDPASFGAVPTNTRIGRFVPQAVLLPHCAAVVHHAGAGTLLGALAHGLPQLAIPQGADNFINAELLEKANVAKRLQPGQATADAVRAAVRELLDDSSYLTAASAVAAQIGAMPSPAQVAADLRAA